MERVVLMRIHQTVLAAQETTAEAIFTFVHAIYLLARITKFITEKITKTIVPQQLV